MTTASLTMMAEVVIALTPIVAGIFWIGREQALLRQELSMFKKDFEASEAERKNGHAEHDKRVIILEQRWERIDERLVNIQNAIAMLAHKE